MEPSELVATIADKLELYLLSGELQPDFIGDALADAVFGDRIAGFDDLLLLHFLLQDDTLGFADTLPRQLREIRTGTTTEKTLIRSEVTEQIDWSRTIIERYARNPDDPTIFVTQSQNEKYDLPENIVLKALTNELERGLQMWEDELSKYAWGVDWSTRLLEQTKQTLAKDPNLDRIRRPKPTEPTAQMLNTACKSRHTLYQEAGDLYLQYQSILGPDPDKAILQELLSETLIVPTDAGTTEEQVYSTLFELYVLFAVIDAIETSVGESGTLQPIRRNRDAVASFDLDDDRTIKIFYEQSGGTSGFSFLGSSDTPNLTRREEVENRYAEIASTIPDMGGRVTTNRPDVLVTFEQDGRVIPELTLVLEVKYQGHGRKGESTIKRGIREALEYVAYMRHDDELVFNDNNEWFGTDSLPHSVLAINDYEPSFQTLTTDEVIVVEPPALSTSLVRLFEQRLSKDAV